MADLFQTIVDTQAKPDQADHLARHVVAWLAGQGVVKPTPSDEGGYDRGPNATAISYPALAVPEGRESIPPVHHHLQILIGRMTHSDNLSEFHEPEADCPVCDQRLDYVDEWEAANQEWIGGDDDAALRCPACEKESPVARWRYGPRYGYGNLAFRFWNWPPLKLAFLDDIRRELGHSIVLVEGIL